MCTLHLFENGSTVHKIEGRINIEHGKELDSIPIETVDGINVYGKPQMTTQCIEECLKRGIPISFFSQYGSYLGGFTANQYIKVNLQRKQAYFYNTSTAMNLAKKIIRAKINNQIILLKRYNRRQNLELIGQIKSMSYYKNKIAMCDEISQVMGYEGISAREYFSCLGRLVKSDFSFHKRTKNPPEDQFNSLLSFGYSLLYKEIYGIVESKGMNPYFGFIHSDREGHPALISDLIEEWRAVIIDSMVMSMINGNEITIEDFQTEDGLRTCYLNNDGRKKFLNKYDSKMNTKISYMSDTPNISYRKTVDNQVRALVRTIENDDVSLYNPIQIR